MTWAFDLWSHEDVAQNADAIQERVRDGSMPCDGAWPDEQIDLFRDWIAQWNACLRRFPESRQPASKPMPAAGRG
jgi:hypothetical protein